MAEQPPSLKPEFLTTQKAAEYILDIIDSAKNRIVLISPYVNPKEIIFVKLEEASKKGKQILLVCNEKSLAAGVKQRINSITNLKLLNHGHAHAKCYYNEEKVMYTSLNLLESSENKNMELGILIKRDHDQDLYYNALAEPEKIVSSCLSKSIPDYKTSKYYKPQNSGKYNFDKFKITEFEVIPEKKGVCIRCATQLNYLNGSLPLCNNCYRTWVQFFNFDFKENYCHWCAKPTDTTKRKPLCLPCFRNYQEFEKSLYKDKYNADPIPEQPRVIPNVVQPPPISQPEIVVEPKIENVPPLPVNPICGTDTSTYVEFKLEAKEKPVEKKSYRKVWVTLLVLAGLAIGTWNTVVHYYVKHRESNLKKSVYAFYKAVEKKQVNVASFFAPDIENYILVKNIKALSMDSLINAGTKEFMASQSRVIDSTFSLSKNSKGNYTATFWMDFKCFRKSKAQWEKCRVHEEFVFDENDRIVSVNELKIEDLKFSFIDPG